MNNSHNANYDPWAEPNDPHSSIDDSVENSSPTPSYYETFAQLECDRRSQELEKTLSYVLNQQELDYYARVEGWIKLFVPASTLIRDSKDPMICYHKDDQRLKFWLASGTVGCYLDLPTQKGLTRLFHLRIKRSDVVDIFQNPRQHTGVEAFHRLEGEVQVGYFHDTGHTHAPSGLGASESPLLTNELQPISTATYANAASAATMTTPMENFRMAQKAFAPTAYGTTVATCTTKTPFEQQSPTSPSRHQEDIIAAAYARITATNHDAADDAADDPPPSPPAPVFQEASPPIREQQRTRNPRRCRYGARCFRKDCWFWHPHRKPCRYGDQCHRNNCNFDHLPTADK